MFVRNLKMPLYGAWTFVVCQMEPNFVSGLRKMSQFV